MIDRNEVLALAAELRTISESKAEASGRATHPVAQNALAGESGAYDDAADRIEALAAKAEPQGGEVVELNEQVRNTYQLPGGVANASPSNGREVLAEMVNRFLSWRVPPDFAPDGGISFTPHPYPECWPIGTNLLTEPQARSMFLQCLPAVAFECSDWKDRALAAEATIERMANEFNSENGRSFMGEPVLNHRTNPAPKPAEGEGWVLGECVEAGTDDDGNVRLTIHTTREALKAGPPLVYRLVSVSLAAAPKKGE